MWLATGSPRSIQGNGGSHARKVEGATEGCRRGLVRQAGETPKRELKGASRQMVDSMSEKQLEDFAKGSRKGKPEHVAAKR